MPANDLRGLVGEQNVPPCITDQPDNRGYFRWVGGAGHEIAHSLSVNHPPGCGGPGPNSGCTGGALAENSLMWFGYGLYPNTYFLAEDKQILLESGFFSNGNFASISGRVTRQDGRGVPGTRLLLWNRGGDSYAITNPFGYYRFLNVPAGASYWVFARHKRHIFNLHQVMVIADLADIDFIAQ